MNIEMHKPENRHLARKMKQVVEVWTVCIARKEEIKEIPHKPIFVVLSCWI